MVFSVTDGFLKEREREGERGREEREKEREYIIAYVTL